MSKKLQPVLTTQKIGLLTQKTSRPLLARTWFQAFVILAMGAALAALIVIEPSRRPPVPELVVGQSAPSDVYATHAFSIVREDITGLEDRRAVAASEVPTVFAFDADLVDDVVGRVGPAFEKMREHLGEAAEERLDMLGVRDAGPTLEAPGTGVGTGALIRPSETWPVLNASDPAVVLTAEQRERVALNHQAELNRQLDTGLYADTVALLGREGFTPETERFLTQLLNEVLGSPVFDPRDLRRVEDLDRITILVQTEGETTRESPREAFRQVITLDEAPTVLRQLAFERPHSLDPLVVDALVEVASELVRTNGNTRLDRGETDLRRRQARATVEPDTELTIIKEGDLLVHARQMVTEEDYETVALMLASSISAAPDDQHANEVVIGGVIYVLMILIGIITYGIRFVRRFNPNFRDLAYMTVTLVIMVAVTRTIMMLAGLIVDRSPDFPVEAIYAAIPFAAGGMLIRLVLNNEHALIYAIVYSLLVALMMSDHPVFAAYVLVGSLVGIGAVHVATTRIAVFRAGMLVGLVNMAFAGAMGLLESSFISYETLATVGLALFGGLAVATLVTALIPLVESTFHYITDIKLLELSNPNHPAIRKLLLRAPGSYQHSMMVGSLVEAACKAIGVHALLGRVGAYYHDIGKSKNPKYFAENQAGKNPHDKLKPHMSALIIKSHVKDGVDMAETHGLPQEIIRFIREHHGTSLIAFFYHKAKELEDPEIESVDEADFRYPGPKPQSAETAVCLLADGIEAASRAMQDPTPARLQGLVQRMINNAFSTGQLDECDLTLRDLDAIAREFIRILCSIYHHRPEYPKGAGGGRSTGEVRRTTEASKKTDASRIKTTQPSDSEPLSAVVAHKDEATNGSGDSSSEGGDLEEAGPDAPETEGPATLRRLGLD